MKMPRLSKGAIRLPLTVANTDTLHIHVAQETGDLSGAFHAMAAGASMIPQQSITASRQAPQQDPKCVADCAKAAAGAGAACSLGTGAVVPCLLGAQALAAACQAGCYRIFSEELLEQILG